MNYNESCIDRKESSSCYASMIWKDKGLQKVIAHEQYHSQSIQFCVCVRINTKLCEKK